MTPFSRDQFKTLMEAHPGLCVSMYQPTHRITAHIEQDRIRFKNMLRQAEKLLIEENGERRSAVGDLLAPAQRLLADNLFWRHLSDGLAVFLAEGMFHHYRLPRAFDELLVVGERFHVKPLVPLLVGDGRYYVLALSQNEVRLLEGTRDHISEVDLQGVPPTLAEALKFDDPEKQLQWHTRAPIRGGERAAIFHGHGVGVDDAKDRILRYFRAVDAGLHELLRDERTPLVLAGVEYYFPIYREANTYAHLIDDGIPGNPEQLQPAELHRRAWEIVGPRFEKGRRDALDRYRQLVGTSKTSAAIEKILPAAYEGRVDTLLVAPDVHLWGTASKSQH